MEVRRAKAAKAMRPIRGMCWGYGMPWSPKRMVAFFGVTILSHSCSHSLEAKLDVHRWVQCFLFFFSNLPLPGGSTGGGRTFGS